MKKVLIFGTFDLLHAGHIEFIKKAKEMGDYLIVILNSDKSIEKRKGRKPIFIYSERKKILSAIKFIDEIIAGPNKETLDSINNLIQRIVPDVIVLSSKQKVNKREIDDLKKRGIFPKIRIIKATKKYKYSSSKIKELAELI